MASKSKMALVFSILATLAFIAAMCTPWWYQKSVDPVSESGDFVLCFIDGTCRTDGFVYKNNGTAQKIFDITMSLMIIAWVPFLLLLHFIFFRRNNRYPEVTADKNIIAVSGILTVLVILAALIVFGTRIAPEYGLPSFYGSREILFPARIQNRWGAYSAFWFALLTVIFIFPAMGFGITMKPKRAKMIVVNETTRLTTAEYSASRS